MRRGRHLDHLAGVRAAVHPALTITLGFQGMELEDTPGQRLGVYLAEPGTPDYDAMVLLDMTAAADAARPAG